MWSFNRQQSRARLKRTKQRRDQKKRAPRQKKPTPGGYFSQIRFPPPKDKTRPPPPIKQEQHYTNCCMWPGAVGGPSYVAHLNVPAPRFCFPSLLFSAFKDPPVRVSRRGVFASRAPATPLLLPVAPCTVLGNSVHQPDGPLHEVLQVVNQHAFIRGAPFGLGRGGRRRGRTS